MALVPCPVCRSPLRCLDCDDVCPNCGELLEVRPRALAEREPAFPRGAGPARAEQVPAGPPGASGR